MYINCIYMHVTVRNSYMLVPFGASTKSTNYLHCEQKTSKLLSKLYPISISSTSLLLTSFVFTSLYIGISIYTVFRVFLCKDAFDGICRSWLYTNPYTYIQIYTKIPCVYIKRVRVYCIFQPNMYMHINISTYIQAFYNWCLSRLDTMVIYICTCIYIYICLCMCVCM